MTNVKTGLAECGKFSNASKDRRLAQRATGGSMPGLPNTRFGSRRLYQRTHRFVQAIPPQARWGRRARYVRVGHREALGTAIKEKPCVLVLQS
jgi:hypothetical protein